LFPNDVAAIKLFEEIGDGGDPQEWLNRIQNYENWFTGEKRKDPTRETSKRPSKRMKTTHEHYSIRPTK
jgi:hypothetical protein